MRGEPNSLSTVLSWLPKIVLVAFKNERQITTDHNQLPVTLLDPSRNPIYNSTIFAPPQNRGSLNLVVSQWVPYIVWLFSNKMENYPPDLWDIILKYKTDMELLETSPHRDELGNTVMNCDFHFPVHSVLDTDTFILHRYTELLFGDCNDATLTHYINNYVNLPLIMLNQYIKALQIYHIDIFEFSRERYFIYHKL